MIADGGQDTIVLHTNDGSIGYRINKLQTIVNVPGTVNHENVLKIYKVSQTSIDGVIDFSDNTLLGMAFDSGSASSVNYPDDSVIIFDSEIFNQDIYITQSDVSGNSAVLNYYIELEQFALDLSESTVATLKDIRNVTTPT